MKIKSQIYSKSFIQLLSLIFFLSLNITNISAQKLKSRTTDSAKVSKTSKPTCLRNLASIKNAYAVMFSKFSTSDNKSITAAKSDCTCILKEFPRLKGCADMTGRKLVKISAPKSSDGFTLQMVESKKLDPLVKERISKDPVAKKSVGAALNINVQITPLAGKTNCRLIASNDEYLIVPPKPTNGNRPELTIKDVIVNKDGNKKNARWDFVPVDQEDDSEGFFIVTREKTPRALMRSGNDLNLVNFKTLDGIGRSKASWNFYVDGIDKDGNSQYLIRPQDSTVHVLAMDQRTREVSVIKNNAPKAKLGSKENTSFVAEKKIHWNVESIF